MKARLDDHIIITRSVFTETGRIAPPGTHGFILRAVDDLEERYVAELLFEAPPGPDEDDLAVLRPVDFDLA